MFLIRIVAKFQANYKGRTTRKQGSMRRKHFFHQKLLILYKKNIFTIEKSLFRIVTNFINYPTKEHLPNYLQL